MPLGISGVQMGVAVISINEISWHYGTERFEGALCYCAWKRKLIRRWLAKALAKKPLGSNYDEVLLITLGCIMRGVGCKALPKNQTLLL